ncbi:MAG: DUF3267 domain-containing protein [Clostridiales bacterium]|nr:DUF3267 domain-containing protein [Clostridiales bacterium]
MLIGQTEYKEILHINLLDNVRRKLINKLNVFAFFAVIVCSVVGVALNYFLRMRGESGGVYILFILAGVPLCLLYIYLHEVMHFLAVLISTGKKPEIKFGKLVASCGSPTISYGKAKYFFVASFPLIFFCATLIPLCVLLPPEFFPLPFIPLCYNIFGSFGDIYMIMRALSVRGICRIIDSGTDIYIYLPETAKSEN